MSKSVPDWADAYECPVDGCDGEYYRDVGGSWARPVMEYPSTCAHNINTCFVCNEKRAIVERYSWPVDGVNPADPGRAEIRRFCEECDNPETIRDAIPDYVFEYKLIEDWEMGTELQESLAADGVIDA